MGWAEQWPAELSSGKRLYADGRYSESAQTLKSALAKAESEGAPQQQILSILLPLTTSQRASNDAAGAAETLQWALSISPKEPDCAPILEDLAIVLRSLQRKTEAANALRQAASARLSQGISEEAARDMTFLGVLHRESGEMEPAKQALTQAILLLERIAVKRSANPHSNR